MFKGLCVLLPRVTSHFIQSEWTNALITPLPLEDLPYRGILVPSVNGSVLK